MHEDVAVVMPTVAIDDDGCRFLRRRPRRPAVHVDVAAAVAGDGKPIGIRGDAVHTPRLAAGGAVVMLFNPPGGRSLELLVDDEDLLL